MLKKLNVSLFLATVFLLVSLILPLTSFASTTDTVPVFDDRDLPVSSDGKEVSKEKMQEFKRTMGEKSSSPPFEGTGKLNPTMDESYDENEKPNSPEEIDTNVVIGTDNRTRVNPTTTYPNRTVTFLDVKYPKAPGSYRCTGFFIDPDTVATAGHCVHDKSKGGWATSITVIPGKTGRSNPFSYTMGTTFYSVKGWTENENSDYDYGAIKVAKSLGNTVGWLGYSWQLSSLNGTGVILQGYPVDKPMGTMWEHSGSIQWSLSNRIGYHIDTHGGQSGAPVYKSTNHAVGIHSGGYSSYYNVGTRITEAKFDNLSYWKGL
ncbi:MULTISPECIES: trypsin-like serine peptidase [Bacillus]|uniref:Serine protease n=2 Tax=Bacillus TaxID=1386 RepID=A0A0M4GD51_9BACI|nr:MULTISPECIES: serine protease [Bacillus]ALC84003.1 hypothetical protein AM592_22780 [Bacillus gobiensis]MBP1082903.1 glutamyl endopeptidase [Bacillus capparidis]MED1098114.1 serine protease [Bacillus capparidis]